MRDGDRHISWHWTGALASSGRQGALRQMIPERNAGENDMASQPIIGPEPEHCSAFTSLQPTPLVRGFHQILLLPLQLMPLKEGSQIHHHWELLEKDARRVWKEVDDEFSVDSDAFQERHYREFMTFLPHVQWLLYGEGAKRRSMAAYGESPIKVFRRTDVTTARIDFLERDEPVVFDVRHVDLYFFYDVDVVILVVEVSASDMPLAVVQESLHRFGRAYPAGWTAQGDGINCPRKVEWLVADGSVLAVSDYDARGQFLASVCRERVPPLAAHWRYLLEPLVAQQPDQEARLRFRHLEHYRMPLMAHLAVNNPECLTRGDFVRSPTARAAGWLPSHATAMFAKDVARRRTGRSGKIRTGRPDSKIRRSAIS